MLTMRLGLFRWRVTWTGAYGLLRWEDCWGRTPQRAVDRALARMVAERDTDTWQRWVAEGCPHDPL